MVEERGVTDDTGGIPVRTRTLNRRWVVGLHGEVLRLMWDEFQEEEPS